MELVVLLLSLWKDFAKPDFDGAAAVKALGSVASQTPRKWLIQPGDPRFSEVALYFEDLEAGKNLLTTIEITLREPWRTDVPAVTSAFGTQLRWLPRPDQHRPRVLQFEPETSPLESVLMLTVSEEQAQQLTVSQITLRRFYPSPK